MGDNFYVDALRAYLTGPEWGSTIRVFIAANCPFFSNIEDLHPQQMIIWRSFQEIAESVIQKMLAEIGGQMAELEMAFDEILSSPSRGPRDEAIKDVLQQLDAVDDFQAFASGMHKACYELFQEIDGDMNDNIHDITMRMGFQTDNINSAIKAVGKKATLEDVLMHLTSVSGNTGSESHHGRSDNYYGADEKAQYPDYYQDNNENTYYDEKQYADYPTESAERRETKAKYATPNEKFVAEAELEGVRIESSEINTLFTIAESVIEAQRESLFNREHTRSETAETTEDLVKWAADMKELKQDLEIAYQEDIPCKDLVFHDEEGLVHWFVRCEQLRQDLNAAAADPSNMLSLISDAELRRMAMLDEIAAMGSENEQRLHGLLSRHETVRTDIVGLYRKCTLFLHTHREMQQDQVEQMYVYLKHQLAAANTQQSTQDDIDTTAQLFSTVATTPEQEQLVIILLDIHILEDEQAMLRREIHALLGVEAEPGADDLDAKHIDVDAKQADNNGQQGWEAKESAGLAINSAFQEMMRLADDPLELQREQEAAAAKVAALQLDSEAQAKDAKQPSPQKTPAVGISEANAASATMPDNNHADSKQDGIIDALKQKHRTALQELKGLLDHQKNQRLQRLEARLALLREQKQKASNSLAVEEVMLDIRATEEEKKVAMSDADTLKDAVMQGFKQRCLAELKAARNKDSKEENENGEVTKDQALKDQASKLLLQQYAVETQGLLQRLQHNRKTQQDALQLRLRGRHANNNFSSLDQEKLLSEETLILQALEQTEASAMLAAAAALQLTPDQLMPPPIPTKNKNKAKKKKSFALMNLDDKDADYLNDDDDHDINDQDTDEDDEERAKRDMYHDQRNQLTEWLSRLQELKSAYAGAGSQLREQLLSSHPTNDTEEASDLLGSSQDAERAEMETASLQAAAAAESVLLQTFTEHVQADFEANKARTRKGKGKNGNVDEDDNDDDEAMRKKKQEAAVKARLLQAFQEAGEQQSTLQSHAQQQAAHRLQQRIQQKNNKSASSAADTKDDANGEDSAVGAVETVEGVRINGAVSGSPTKSKNLMWTRLLQEAASSLTTNPLKVSKTGHTPSSSPLKRAPSFNRSSPQKRDIAEAKEDTVQARAAGDTKDSLDHANAQLDEAAQQRERERIKEEHIRRERALVKDLQAAMEQKKRNLEDRYSFLFVKMRVWVATKYKPMSLLLLYVGCKRGDKPKLVVPRLPLLLMIMQRP